MPVRQMPVCLTIAGSDSGGGAGIQADLRAFQYFGTHGTTVITAVTAQNPQEVTSIHAVPTEEVVKQLETVLKAIKVSAIKTGMLFSKEIIEAVADVIAAKAPKVPLVVDPVMVATSGAVLLNENAIDALAEKLVPMATVITPNLPEAEILVGQLVDHDDEENTFKLASQLADELKVAVLLKGGHRENNPAMDALAMGDKLYRISTPEVHAQSTHGTGCMLSSAMAANLALGKDVQAAIVAAKAYVYHSLTEAHRIGPRTFAMKPPRTNDETIVGVAPVR